jgi:hypothetical protein
MKTVRLVSAVLLFGAAACSGDRITGTQPRLPATVAHDGGGYLGGGGDRAAAHAAAFAR